MLPEMHVSFALCVDCLIVNLSTLLLSPSAHRYLSAGAQLATVTSELLAPSHGEVKACREDDARWGQVKTL